MNDLYLTISTTGEGYYTEKRSKFLAWAHHVDTVDEVKSLLADYRTTTASHRQRQESPS